MKRDEISSWTCPTWHPDWGDPSVEFGMLQDFCFALSAQAPTYEFVLECPEQGYMIVSIERNGRRFAELNVVERDDTDLQYGVFSLNANEDHEFYFTDIYEGCRQFLDQFASG